MVAARLYRVGPLAFEARSDDLTVAAAIDRHFGPFRASGGTRAILRFSIHVRSPLPGLGAPQRAPCALQVRSSAGRGVESVFIRARIKGAPQALYYLYIEPVIAQKLKDYGLYPTHAACLARRGTAILLCGPDNAGKSSTAWTLERRGFRLLSDEDAYIARAGGGYRVWAGSRGISFTEEGAQRLFRPVDLARMAWTPAGERWKFWIPFSPPRRGSARLGAIAFLRRRVRPGRVTRIVPLLRAEAVYRLLSGETERAPLPKGMQSALPGNHGWLAGLMGRAPAYEAELGTDPEDISRAFLRVADSLTRPAR